MKMQLQIFKPVDLPVLIIESEASDLLRITESMLSPGTLPLAGFLSSKLKDALIACCIDIHDAVSDSCGGYCAVRRGADGFFCVIWLASNDITVLAHEGVHLIYYLRENELLDGSESEAYFLQSLLLGWNGDEFCTPDPVLIDLESDEMHS